MELEAITTLIGQYAFPIAMCIAMFWKINTDDTRRAEERQRDSETHKAEMDTMRQALENNTNVLIRLETMLRKESNTHES